MQNSVALFTGHSEHKFYKLFYWLSALINANTIVSMIYRAYKCTPLRFQAVYSGYFLGTRSPYFNTLTNIYVARNQGHFR